MLWHYTNGRALADILKHGAIVATQCRHLPGERPIVWLTLSDDWEPMCNKTMIDPDTLRYLTLSREETAAHFGGLARFGISEDHPNVMRCNKVVRKLIADRNGAKSMFHLAERLGSRPEHDWRGSQHEIRVQEWRAVEFFWLGRWRATSEVNPEDVANHGPGALWEIEERL